MPELPDVEHLRRYFARYAAGRRVEAVEVRDRSVVRNRTPQALGRVLKRRRLGAPVRHGKWLWAPAGASALLFHFGMDGELVWTSRPDGYHVYDRVVFRLGGGALRYRSRRKLGGVWVARDERERTTITGPLGPDALDRAQFDELLGRRPAAVKPALMNQKRIAGVGNELSDEILWHARIHPARDLRALEERDRDGLYRALRKVLRESVREGKIPRRRGWLTAVRGNRDAACPRCGTRFARGKIGGRTAYWCPRCQRDKSVA